MNFNYEYLINIAKRFGYTLHAGSSVESLRDFLITRFAELKYYTNLGKLTEFSFYQGNAIQAFKTHIPHLVLNCTISFPSQELPSFNSVSKFFGKPPYLWVFEESQAVLEQELIKHKLTYLGNCTGMLMDLDDLRPYSMPPHIQVKRVQNAEDLNIWISIVEKVNGISRQYLQPFAEVLFQNPQSGSHFYLAYLNDIPAATSLITIESDVVALYSVTTLPEYRNKGLGFAVSYQPLRDALNTGAKIATLSSSELGKPVYTKIGFQEYCIFKIYALLQ